MQKSPFKILAAGLLAVVVCPALGFAQGGPIRAVTEKGRTVFTNIGGQHSAPIPSAVQRIPEPGSVSMVVATPAPIVLPSPAMKIPISPPRPAAPRLAPVPVAVVADLDGAPPAIGALVHSISRSYGVDPALVSAVIKTESNYDRWAVSSKGARGLMQLIPETGRRFGVEDFFDPRQNIEGGVRYLKFLLDKFGGNVELSVAAYNAGEGTVEKLGRVPPFDETREYVRRIRQMYPKKNALILPEPEPVAMVMVQRPVSAPAATSAAPQPPLPAARLEDVPADPIPARPPGSIQSALASAVAASAVAAPAPDEPRISVTRDARGVTVISNNPK